MNFLRLLRSRLYGLFHKEQIEEEMNDEMRFHINMRVQEYVRRGMTEEEARREAMRRFGHLDRIKEACRDIKGGGIMETLIQDVRYGARTLLKNPGFALIAVLTLALGIGANTTIFSIVNAILLRPLPYPEPQRIMRVNWQWNKGETDAVSAAEYDFWKEHSQSFEVAAGYSGTSSGFNLVGGAEPLRVQGMLVSEEFFRVLGVGPMLGRSFAPEEDKPKGPRAALISYGLWQSYFGGDPSVIGRNVQVNGESCPIVGVLPQSFQFEEAAVDVFLPLQLRVYPKDQGHNTDMIARLRPGITIQHAQAEMDQLLPQFREAYPNHAGPTERGVRLVQFQESVVGDVSKTLLLLFGAVGFVLLIACANVASLLLARAANRRGEMAVRIALGAGRLRLIRQLMTENLLLALTGGAFGLILAVWGMPLLLSLSPSELPRASGIKLDTQAMLFAILASFITSLLFGIVPALQATRLDVNQSLKSSAGRAGGSKLGVRRLLMVTEVALSLILLVGAALLVKSFIKLRSVELGFEPQNLMTMQLSLNSAKYTKTAQVWNLQQQLIEKIRALPGVAAVATVPGLPMERGLNYFVTFRGRTDNGRSVEMRAISPDYFRALGATLKSGRAFTDADAADSTPVAVINEDLARRYWPEGNAIGDQIFFNDQNHQIVGIAADIREKGLDRPVAPTVYLPASQVPDALTIAMSHWFLTSWLIRTSGPVDLSAAIREAARAADPELPVAKIRPMNDVISGSIAQQRFIMTLMGIFALLALLLTSIGLYGVLSYQVSQRTQEIGIRMALGARGSDVVKLIVRQGMSLTLLGIVIGLAAAFALTRLLSSLLFNVSATDPLTFTFISALLIIVALAACLIPARRATRVDPLIALRYE